MQVLLNDPDAINATEIINNRTGAGRVILPIAINKKSLFVSPRDKFDGRFPYPLLVLFHRVCKGIPVIEIPSQIDFLCIGRKKFKFV